MKKFFLSSLIILFCLNGIAQLPSWLPSNGLILWYPFNGNANDESGNGYNGTVFGASLTTDHNGAANKAYNFNGSTDYILSHDIDVPSAYTLFAWVKPTNTIGSIISRYGSSPISYELMFNNATFGLYSHVGDASDPNNNIMSYQSLPVNSWHLATFVYDNGNAKIYIDTTLYINQNGVNTPSNNDTQMQIGKSVWGGNQFTGGIDNVAIYFRALTKAEITQIFFECSVNITANPSSQFANSGSTVQFAVAASGSGNTFQWQQDTGTGYFNIPGAAPYSGVTDDTLIINGVDLSMDNASFRCVVTSGACTATSSAAMLSVTNKSLVFSQVLLVTTQQTVPANKVWKVESATGSFLSQYNYRSRNDADFNPSVNLILINGVSVSVANAIGTGAGHGSGDAGGSSGFSYAASPTNFPIWLPAGSTLATSSNISFISVIEFNIVSP